MGLATCRDPGQRHIRRADANARRFTGMVLAAQLLDKQQRVLILVRIAAGLPERHRAALRSIGVLLGFVEQLEVNLFGGPGRGRCLRERRG